MSNRRVLTQSTVRLEQACSNAEEEIPDFNFERVRSSARAQWNALLGRIQVKTDHVDPEIVSLLYSSSYRAHISPADCESDSPPLDMPRGIHDQ